MDRTQPAVRRSFRLRIAMSAVGPKRTSLVAMHMSAFDPKRTCVADACSLRSKLYGSACLTPGNGMINPKDYDRTNNCNYHAIDIETCYSRRAKKTEYNSSHNGADNAKGDASSKPWPCLLTILLPINPAMRPSMIQLMMDMRVLQRLLSIAANLRRLTSCLR